MKTHMGELNLTHREESNLDPQLEAETPLKLGLNWLVHVHLQENITRSVGSGKAVVMTGD